MSSWSIEEQGSSEAGPVLVLTARPWPTCCWLGLGQADTAPPQARTPRLYDYLVEKVVWNLYFKSLQLNFEAEEITNEVKNKDWRFNRQDHRICRSLLNVVYTKIILYKI